MLGRKNVLKEIVNVITSYKKAGKTYTNDIVNCKCFALSSLMETDDRPSDAVQTESSLISSTGAIITKAGHRNNSEDNLKISMIDHLVFENKAFFRSQQINDPDITDNERKSIAEELLQESHKKFLFRFGAHIREEHLSFFENQCYSSEDEYEVKYLLKDIRTKLKNRVRDVRNRRYVALQKMLDSTTYFSEKEMMSREPLLYEQLIGRYMTDGEKRLRDGADPDTEFSGVLLERISNDHVIELKQKQETEEHDLAEDDSDDSVGEDPDQSMCHRNGIINEKLFPQTPTSFRQHWGEFDSKDSQPNTVVATSTKRLTVKQNYITAEEKDLLKEEFIGIMHAKFLSGEDTEINYSDVDDNLDYEDYHIELQSQDQEDKYFDGDDDSSTSFNQINEQENDSSEDELDAYMKQISN